jgi:hypothetical protein
MPLSFWDEAKHQKPSKQKKRGYPPEKSLVKKWDMNMWPLLRRYKVCYNSINGRRNDMPLKKLDKVTFPLSVFETADTKEDLEDWLLSQNPEFIKKMRKARRDDMQGKGKSWESLKKELCIQ